MLKTMLESEVNNNHKFLKLLFILFFAHYRIAFGDVDGLIR